MDVKAMVFSLLLRCQNNLESLRTLLQAQIFHLADHRIRESENRLDFTVCALGASGGD